MRIRNNVPARFGLRENRKTGQSMRKNLEKLSSGLRINRAADDAAGLSASEKMRANISETARCQTNVLEGLDLTRTADGALAEINDMLCRAKKLCLEAENGTYSEQERASISDEINALFGEIDRIAEDSHHNTIPLFRREIENSQSEVYILEADTQYSASPGAKANKREAVREYADIQGAALARTANADDETIGKIDFIEDGPFDPASPPAKAASVTFTLAVGIDTGDANSLSGRSIQIGSNVYCFLTEDATQYTPYYNSNGNWVTSIQLYNNSTFEQAIQTLVNYCPDISGYALDTTNNTLTLIAKIDDLVDSVLADGKDNDYFVKDGDGSKKNGLQVSNIGGNSPIEQVDGDAADNNKPVHSTQSKMNFSLDKLSGNLTADDIVNLQRNSISMTLGDTTISLDLSGKFHVGMTKAEVGAVLAQEFELAIQNDVNTKNDYTCQAKFDPNTGNVDIDIASPTGKSVSASFQEYSPPATVEERKDWTAVALEMTITNATQGSVEEGYTMEIKPRYGDVKKPFAFYLGSGSTREDYIFFDSTEYPLGKTGGHDDCSLSYYIKPDNRIDVAGKTEDEIKELVTQKIVEYGNKLSYVKKADVNPDGTVTFSVIVGGSEHPTAGGLDISVSSWKNEQIPSGGYGNVFGDNNAESVKKISTTFSLGNDINALAGKGFNVSSYQYWNPSVQRWLEFTNGTVGKIDTYTDVDISQCRTFEEVRILVEEKLNEGMDPQSSNRYTVELKQNGANYEMTVSATVTQLYVTACK